MSGELVDPLQFLKQLPPDQFGQYEPVSGIMLINISSAELNAIGERYRLQEFTEADIDVMRAINHEIYHFAQTVASGYMYLRQHRLFCCIRDAKLPDLVEVPETGGVPSLVAEMDRLSVLRERARPGDPSFAGAVMPELFAAEKALAALENETNAAGLSIRMLVEGSAVVHAERLVAGGTCTRPALEKQLEIVPPAYRTLFDLTADRYGDRALDLILPATALALRYTRPHDAYFDLLAAIADSADDPVTRGRALASSLPQIAEAGAVLGTAIDVHQPTEQFSVYDAMLRDLADGKWQVDSYDLLADPYAMHRMPAFPIGWTTRDGYSGLDDINVLTARLILMSIVLRVRSLAREQRDFEKAMRAWMESMGQRWFGSGEPR